MAFLTQKEIKDLNFKFIGKNVMISDKAAFYGTERIEISDNSRIDDFCLISAGKGGIKIGKYVHIACYCSLIGAATITLEDFSGLSSRVAIYSSSDDYSGNFLTNPTVPARYKNVIDGEVHLEKHVIVGAGAVILPNVKIQIGSAVGALSLVTKNCESFGIYSGVPARFLKKRSTKLLELEEELQNKASETD